MTVENVQCHATEDGVTQSWRLLQLISRRELAAWTIPRAPLIHRNLDVVLPVKLTHDLPMPGNHRFHAFTLVKQFVPIHRPEFERVAFAFVPVLGLAATQVPGIVM